MEQNEEFEPVEQVSVESESAEQEDAETELVETDESVEVVELEISEEDIVRYLEDENGELIGFVIMEDGEEAEYLYVEDDEDNTSPEDDEFDLGISHESVSAVTDDANAIFRDGVAVAAEFKGAFDDIKSAFDFKSMIK